MATLVVVTQTTRVDLRSIRTKMLACVSIWVVPLITATTATAMGEMTVVTGNWCWISARRTDLRYGLTHGWRFAIILATIGIYAYVYWYLGRHFRSLAMGPFTFTHRGQGAGAADSSGGSLEVEGAPEEDDEARLHRRCSLESGTCSHAFIESDSSLGPGPGRRPLESGVRVQHDILLHSQHLRHPAGPSRSGRGADSCQKAVVVGHQASPTQLYMRNKSRQAERDIKRMLLLNGYPIMYIILWIPGIANRVMEATGQTKNTGALNILQCSTQFVGFANALTYGLNIEIREKLSRDLFGRTRRRSG